MAHQRLCKGAYVRVIDSGRYRDSLKGKTGTIKAIYSESNFAVLLDGMKNVTSQYGYFYFEASQIECVMIEETSAHNEREDNMPIDNYLNIAMIRFLDAADSNLRLHEYANFDPSLAIGDRCVVMSANHGMGLAEVVDIKPRASKPVTREIVTRFDTSEYDARVEQREKAADLRARMKERAKSLQDLVLFQTLAQSDPEMASLVQQYMGLMGGTQA